MRVKENEIVRRWGSVANFAKEKKLNVNVLYLLIFDFKKPHRPRFKVGSQRHETFKTLDELGLVEIEETLNQQKPTNTELS